LSSRRRHTRFSRDWSSDVCSSDLPLEVISGQAELFGDEVHDGGGHLGGIVQERAKETHGGQLQGQAELVARPVGAHRQAACVGEIGRASCRERVQKYVDQIYYQEM